jgi:hypothetical protein
MACDECFQKGHTAKFCPAVPNNVPEDRRVPYLEWRLALPRVKIHVDYKGMTWAAAMQKVEAHGKELSADSPWATSTYRRDALRKQVGFWKAMGANRSLISWLGYGVPMNFWRDPGKFMFANQASCDEHEEFIQAEIDQHLADGSFKEVDESFVKVCNPIH